MPQLLLVDDEDKFRISMSERLKLRGFDNIAIGTGDEALKIVRQHPEIDVVILDRKLPGMSGEQVLRELKHFRPDLQVIILTGYGSIESAVETGKLDAYSYLQKPCELDVLIGVIERARKDRPRIMERHEISELEKGSFTKWFWGTHNFRPGMIIVGILAFLCLVYLPAPNRLTHLLTFQKKPMIAETSGQLRLDPSDEIIGYSGYAKMMDGETIVKYYTRTNKVVSVGSSKTGEKVTKDITIEETAGRAKVMLGILIVGVIFWATGALPIGITALGVGGAMYFYRVLLPDAIAAAYAKDAVIFIFGVLVIGKAISKTGLDRRIGLLLMGSSNSLWRFMFIFLPLVGIACAFLSEHAIVAFLMPIVIIVYISAIKAAGVEEDRALAVMLVLSLCYAVNCAGPGSPAAGGRNAVMVGILSEYDLAPSFGQWVKYGLPFVPVMALVIGLYFFLVFRGKIKSNKVNFSTIVRQASTRIGPMNRTEFITAGVLILLMLLWVTASDVLGMGGPVILAIVLLAIFRIINWADVAKIQWEIVALYASACALAKGLATTGAALYLADGFINILPDFMRQGEGLAVACSIFTGITSQFMSDGATVSAIGPITVPMAIISGTNAQMVGFATSFGSSFAHTLLIGSPNNAIAYAMARDPHTGKQLVTVKDFLKHGFFILLLSWAVLWGWLFFGYWKWIGF